MLFLRNFRSIKRFLYTLCAFLLASTSWGQMTKKDSLRILRDTMKIYYLDLEHFDQTALTSYNYEDTGITHTRFFDPSLQNYVVNASLGNLFTANNPMIFRPNKYAGFDAGYHSYDAYLFDRWNTKFHLTARPLTKVEYFLGMGSEQHLKILHTQRIVKNLQLGIEYNHTNSAGFYSNQRAMSHHFRLMGRFNSINGKYKLIFSYQHNNLFFTENGGLQNDSVFEANSFGATRTYYLVNLDSAQQRWYNHVGFIQQAYTFNRKNIDTTTKVAAPLLTFMHTLQYEYRVNRYRDPLPNKDFYGPAFFDSTFTRHGLEYHQLQNEFKILLYLKKRMDAQSPLTVGVKHEFIDLNNFIGVLDSLEKDSSATHSSFHNLNAFGGITFNINPQISLEASGYFYFAGYNIGDFGAQFKFHYQSKDSAKVNQYLTASVRYRQFEPSWIFQNFQSNYRKYQLDLEKQRELNISLIYKIKSWNLDLTFNSYLVNNYTYFDTLATPVQLADVANVFTLELHKRFRAWKIYFDPLLIGQYSTTDQIRLPYFAGRLSIYFQGFLFKKALLLNAGIDVSYNTPYMANSYDPIASAFYLQNHETTGNYPFLDLQISGRVKSVRFFIKLRNVNQRFPNVPYYTTPHYPLQDRSVQVGICWNFLN